MIHAKKVLPEYFEPLRDGRKRFELRREDPSEPCYAVGDYLALNEYEPGRAGDLDGLYTGRCLLYQITYVLHNAELLAPGCVALGLKLAPLSFEDVQATLLPR